MKNKKVFYTIVLCVLIVTLIILSIIIINIQADRKENEHENKELLEKLKVNLKSEEVPKLENVPLEFEGCKVIGIIKIPKISLEYPILSETTKSTMKKSISRFWGEDINSYGNVSLAGHNNYDGTMFGKIKKLEIGDIVELTDLSNRIIEYEVKEIFSTDPNDVTILETTNSEIREVTLITCTNGHAERLIVKAYEKNILGE